MEREKLIQQIHELTRQNAIMRQLATPKGFYDYWFKNLPNYNTRIECFNAVNDLYFSYFGEYRYSTYNSFQCWSRDNKRRK